MLKKGLMVVLLTLFISCEKHNSANELKMGSMNFLVTEDGLKISYDFYEGGSKGIILLHRLNQDKSSWSSLIPKLQDKGYSVIAIDLRGHGNSDLDWHDLTFTEKEFNNMVLDAKSAYDFLKSREIKEVAIIGESIGANTALNFALTNLAKTAILISPGEDYRGIKTLESAKKVKVPVLTVVGKQDEYSYQSSGKINNLIKTKKQLKTYNVSDHGTQLFLAGDAEQIILEWLNENL